MHRPVSKFLPGLLILTLLFLSPFQASLAALPGLVEDINVTPSAGSMPVSLTVVDDQLMFVADDGLVGEEIWKIGPSGLALVKDIAPGADSLVPTSLLSYEDHLYFTGNDGTSIGEELWVSDGTVTGTLLLKDINPSGDSDPARLKTIGSNFYFQANDGTNGSELWISDGSFGGTQMIKDIFPGPGSSSPALLTNLNGILFFVASDGVHGEELWRSDGTLGGTLMVRDIFTGTNSSTIRQITSLGNNILFRADDGVHGTELWISDGFEGGTNLVRDIFSGQEESFPDSLKMLAGEVIFSANDGIHGFEIWKSDGTETGTQMVKDLLEGSLSSIPVNFETVGENVFFSAFDLVSGRELWVSNGTSAGTHLVEDIQPGLGSSTPLRLTNVNGILFFQANDGLHGGELWKSNGTQASTFMVMDINPLAASSNPGGLTVFGEELYFSADDGIHGQELWSLSLVAPPFVVDAGGDYSGSEGSSIAITATQVSGDELIASNWVSVNPTCSADDPLALETQVVCNDNGVYTMTLEALDWWNNSATDVMSITVENAPPQITQLSFSSTLLVPGKPVTATLEFLDAGAADSHTAKIDWGDGITQTMAVDQGLTQATASHSYAAAGDYSLIAGVDDDDGGSDQTTAGLSVQPFVIDAGGPYSGNEGSAIAVSGSLLSGDAISTAGWTSTNLACQFGNPAATQTSITCPDNGVMTVTLLVQDAWGNQSEDSAVVVVGNLAPQITQLSFLSEPLIAGKTLTARVVFSDAGGIDTHTAVIDWGDGASQDMVVDQALDQAIASHVYARAGTWMVQVTVTDKDGAPVTSSQTIEIRNWVFLPHLNR